jgi:nucleotide-binding universal stress UspA family protein
VTHCRTPTSLVILARHDLNVDLKRIVSKETDVANTILSYAADVSADFIVMGGYGHCDCASSS